MPKEYQNYNTLEPMTDDVDPPKAKTKAKSNFAASCSNFSIQYNLAAASVSEYGGS
jgi:hypothetical protein